MPIDVTAAREFMRETQRAATREAWQRLTARGYRGRSEIELDFWYEPARALEAGRLLQYLTRETDYFVEITTKRWALRSKAYTVTGHTRPNALRVEQVQGWVEWMIDVGLQHGCLFEGWGTSYGGRLLRTGTAAR